MAFPVMNGGLSRVQTEDNPRLILDAVVLGVCGGLSAQLFVWMLRLSSHFFLGTMAGFYPPGLPADGGVLREAIGPHGLWLIPLVTTLGGLISGLLVYKLAPETEGHGTDVVVKAVHWTGGTIRARVAPVKMIASALTIGSGGSAGREGPTALISAGVGSVYAEWLHRSTREKRLIVLMGMAAGLAAIFRSPIGTALFAVEVLYGGIEFEAEALLYCMLSSVVAYMVNGSFVGWKPLFVVPAQVAPTTVAEYGWFALLGIASGVVATALPEIFYRIRDGFLALRVPPWIKPAIGGLGLGAMALALPEVLGGGYGWIQEAINGQLALKLLVALLAAKIAGMALTVSSGGSGGVFAPSLFTGAMLGGAFAAAAHQPAAGLVVVGMCSVFGGAARVPVATLLMVAEMTGGYQLLVPACLAVTLSFLVQMRLSKFVKYGSLYEGQVVGRIDSPAHRAEHVALALQILNSDNVALPPQLSHLHLAALLQSGVALDLPDQEQLTAGALRPDSRWVGKSIADCALDKSAPGARILAILRGTTVITPHAQTILQPGDRLLILASKEAQAKFNEHLASPSAALQKSDA
ncbi:MAG TPA: chloride channel protein [Terracidiphilus sp.]|nr:chloride channel protein [Terracidiphilus sp.]